MIYTYLYVMIFDACTVQIYYLGQWKSLVFGPQMALTYWHETISQGLKNSLFQGKPPPPCPCNGSAHIKNITHGPYKS